MFTHNHTYEFYQKYFRIFECQINRYERTQEYMNENHKYEIKVKPISCIGCLKKKIKINEKGKIIFFCNLGKMFVSDTP